MRLPYRKLREDAQTPFRAHASDAGLDLAPVESDFLQPGECGKLATGLAFAIPDGHVGLIRARSSTTLKSLTITGVIDAGYRGEVHLMVTNIGPDMERVEAGKRIAQLIIVPIVTPSLDLVTSLDDTDRGASGFGDSGT